MILSNILILVCKYYSVYSLTILKYIFIFIALVFRHTMFPYVCLRNVNYFFIPSFTIRLHKEEKKEKDVLNIFSVASGHLYERFLR